MAACVGVARIATSTSCSRGIVIFYSSRAAGLSEPQGRDRANGCEPTAPAAIGAPAPGPVLDARGNGWLDLLVGDLARVLNCELALVCETGGDHRARIVAACGLDGDLAIAVPRRVGGRWGNGRAGCGGGGGGFVGRALAHGRPAYETLDPERDRDLIEAAAGAVAHALAVPVQVFGDDRRRVLAAGFSAPLRDLENALWIADSYARLVSLVDQGGALGGLPEGARRDGLTGCLTYRSSVDELNREINRSARAGLRLSCCFIDLDGFKRVSDLHGRPVRDEVLADVGRVLRDGVRSCDTVGRNGGDEFIAILPQTDETEAALLAERLRSLIASRYARRFDGWLTASSRVVEWTPGISAEQLLGGALSAAKALRGGDAVHSHRDPTLVTSARALAR